MWPMSPPSSRLELPRTRPRLCPSVAAAAAIVLMSGCSHVGENAATPTPPSTSPASPSKPAQAPRPSDPEVRAAQDYLAQLGYYDGSIDGINGPKTRTAVASFQTDSGLPPDGKVSRDLIARLAGTPSTPGKREKADSARPVYEPGDAYAYTDGEVETVLSTSETRVEWQDAKGQRWSADADFTVPSRRSDPGADVASLKSLTWPLRVGATAAFTVKTAAADRAEHWQCAVEAREQTTVVAGIFDSYKITCRRDDVSLGAARSRTWYYAPAIGHYVRYVDNAADESRSRDLISVSPGELGWPPEARTGLEWAMSHALEAEPDGKAVPWQSSAVAARFVIESGPRVDAGLSGQCRRFRQTKIAADTTKRVYPGVACRVQNRWRPFASAADSTS